MTVIKAIKLLEIIASIKPNQISISSSNKIKFSSYEEIGNYSKFINNKEAMNNN